ncbi:methyltransferase [Acinetobacter puyangensis]|uniref:methyltransferase n=1 Tax=Acinetobacter puyangensis TaxID=1096779 RepID=UPI003A4DB873
MDAKSEVLLRQPELFSGNILLVNAPQDQLSQSLDATVSIWSWNFADHQYFLQSGYHSVFDIVPPQQTFDQAIIFIPKAKELLNYVLEHCAAILGQDKPIFLVGEKKAGIEGAAKQLQAFAKPVKIDSARHCQLWQVKTQQQHQVKPLEAWLKHYQYTFKQTHLDICALPGVFSQDHLDIGTQQILPFLAQVKAGKILDFGCGAGIISAILAKSNPKNHMTAVDIDAFALHSTQLTFARNNISSQLTTIAITDIRDVDGRFHAIVSNPPFHQGIKTHYQASENLCQFSKVLLRSAGELWIVANRFLNYQPFIENSFGHCQIKSDQNGFKVFYANKK